MSASMPGHCFDGLKVSPDLSLSKVLELGVPSGLAESDRGSGKISIGNNSCDPQVNQGGDYYG
jgi:hypothetical protein